MKGGKCKQLWLEGKCTTQDEETLDGNDFQVNDVYVAEYEVPQLAVLAPRWIDPAVVEKFVQGATIDYEEDNRAPTNDEKRKPLDTEAKDNLYKEENEDVIMQ